jgi:hypothetical protein
VHRVALASTCDVVLALQLQIISGGFCLGKEIASKTQKLESSHAKPNLEQNYKED